LTLRVLWQMAQAHRESRRWLACDVWRLYSASSEKRVDFAAYLQTGAIIVNQQYPLPESDAMEHAMEAARQEEIRNPHRQA